MTEDRQDILAELDRIQSTFMDTIETLQKNINKQIELNKDIMKGVKNV